MKPVNKILKPFTNFIQKVLGRYNVKVLRLIHGSILFIEEGEHFGIKCPLKNKNLKVAEIGVYTGVNSEEIIKYLDVRKLYLIDPYKEYEDMYMEEINFNKAENTAKRKMKKFGNKIKFIKEYSSDAVDKIPNDMDYIYIDGNHNYEYVKADIENYWNKVKYGGILAGHDIDIKDVLKAVLEFTKKNKLDFIVAKGDWIIIKKQFAKGGTGE